MRYLVLIVTWLAVSASAAQSTNPAAQDTTLETVDKEMIALLQLRDDQVDGYLKVIRVQRKALSVLSDAQWEKQLDLYKGTIDKLKPVLSEDQLARFTAYLGCLISKHEYETQYSLEYGN